MAAIKLQLEECRHDNQIKLNKMKNELANKTEQYHRQIKKEKVGVVCSEVLSMINVL